MLKKKFDLLRCQIIKKMVAVGSLLPLLTNSSPSLFHRHPDHTQFLMMMNNNATHYIGVQRPKWMIFLRIYEVGRVLFNFRKKCEILGGKSAQVLHHSMSLYLMRMSQHQQWKSPNCELKGLECKISHFPKQCIPEGKGSPNWEKSIS